MEITHFISNEACLRAVVYIEDALDYKSLLHRTDPVSLQLYRFMRTTLYQIIYGGVVTTLLLLAFFEKPSSLSASSDFSFRHRHPNTRYELSYGITQSIEMICILLLIIDYGAKCKICNKAPWKSRWLVGYGIVNLVYFISLIVYLAQETDKESDPVRAYRCLRPFYMIQNSSIMKKMLNAIRRSMPEVLGVLVVLALNLMIFGVVAHILFADNIVVDEGTYFGTIRESMWKLLVLFTTANNPDVMLPAYKKNRLYFIFFFVFIWLGTYGLMNLLLAVIYNQFRQHFNTSLHELVKRRNIALRAAFEVLTNPSASKILSEEMEQGLLDHNSLLVEDYEPEFDPSAPSTSLSSSKPKQSWIEVATLTHLLESVRMKKRYKKYVLQVLDDANKLQTDILDKQDFVKLFIDIETDYVDWSKKMAARQNTLSVRRLHTIVSHWAFEMVGTALAFFNTAFLFIMLCQTSKEAINVGATIVLDLNIFITVYFVIEQVLRLLGHGPRFYFTHISFVFDLAITLTLAVLTIILYSDPPFVDEGMSEDITRGINLLICLRFTRVFLQVKRLRVVVKTYLTLIRQMQVYLGILAALMYVYAIIGMELFSIELTNDIHNRSAVDEHHKLLSRQCGTYWNLDYYSLNFDDFFASIVTLFTLMVVNNWHVLVDAFSQSRGEWWAGFYFISWWVVCVLIILNVIIALILDAFIARWDNKDQDTRSGGHFHVHQFVDQSERVRAMSEGEVTNELAKINIVKKPFTLIGNDTPDMPSAREATSRKIYCAN